MAILEPILRELAVSGGYVHSGGPGAGHFVKLVHNGIEFGQQSCSRRLKPREEKSRTESQVGDLLAVFPNEGAVVYREHHEIQRAGDLDLEYNTGSDELRIPNLMPDIITRVAFNPRPAVHLDAGGVLRVFRHSIAPYGNDNDFKATAGGGGRGQSAPMFPTETRRRGWQ